MTVGALPSGAGRKASKSPLVLLGSAPPTGRSGMASIGASFTGVSSVSLFLAERLAQ